MDDVFVVGMSDAEHRQLDRALGDRYRFHPLLEFSDVRYVDEIDFDALVERASAELDGASSVDGVMGYWDFPTTSLVPVLQQRFGLPGASLEAVARCEHKYWSRRIQAEVVGELVPSFVAFDPAEEDALAEADIAPPYWVKPVKAFASQLARCVEDEDDRRRALRQLRREVRRFGEPFDRFLARVELPPAIEQVPGTWCLAEEALSGHQCTVEGYVHDGEVTVHGVIDSYREEHPSSFSHFQYPSALDDAVKQRLATATAEVIEAIGYDGASFNIEFFVDAERDEVNILEINPRISQSHAELFEFVDGTPNYEVAAALAVGRAPQMTRGAGDHRCAGKFFIRSYEDATVTAVPSAEKIAALEEEVGGAHIEVVVEEGMRLSEVREQDPYSCVLATFHVGAGGGDELAQRAAHVRERLRFDLTDLA